MKKRKTHLLLSTIFVVGLMFVGMQAIVPVDGLAQSLDDPNDAFFIGTPESAGPHNFYPVTPCRISESRPYYAPWAEGEYRGPFSAGQTICFSNYGYPSTMRPQGGNQAGCSSPVGEPGAFHVVVTASPISGAGHVRLYPANVARPNASVLNWSVQAGNVSDAVSADSYESSAADEFCIYIGGSGSTHIAMDVMGYFD
jgi:hypothetical protein